ncbi:hypothetical protein [Variovorax sp. E3]|uniref:hypothetical protein n=1 Tax=Variovorax sp. E3 TaxID=1914993 RepID=UPI0018DE7010|nr:hypothetical protein [Variovorax sp. E3]
MTMECLRKIAEKCLPYEVYEVSEINKLSVLRAAGLIMAFIPPPGAVQDGETYKKAATVLAVTQKGRLMLQDSADNPSLGPDLEDGRFAVPPKATDGRG